MASSLRHGQGFSHAENELTQPSIEISPVGLEEGHQEPERSNISLGLLRLDRKDVWCVLRISWNLFISLRAAFCYRYDEYEIDSE